MGWTSRRRVVAAVNHREPDRVPLNLTMELDAYAALKAYLRLDFPETLRPNSLMEVDLHPRVLEALGVDIVPVHLSSPRNWRPSGSSAGTQVDEWGVARRQIQLPSGGTYMEVAHNPLQNATRADLSAYPWPDPAAPGRADGVADRAARLYNDTDLAIMGRFGGPILEMGGHLLGWEAWWMRLVDDPAFAGELLDRVTDIQMALDEIGLRAAGRYLSIFKVSGEDMGMQSGPLVSRRTFEDVIRPRFARRWQAARRVLDEINPGCRLMLHSCGSVRAFIPDFIECGIDILDPLQPHAARMDSRELKQEFGERLVFHGGIDVQHVLPFGTRDEVIVEVRDRILDYAPGGGYIAAPAHNVQVDVPPANLVTMCQAVHELGRYPIELGSRSGLIDRSQ